MVDVQVKNVAMPSNKHSGRRGRTQILAVHSAESPLERGYAKSLTHWSNTSPQVLSSWNTFVDPGVCVRAVNTFNAAWHASWANGISVGYEQAGYAAFGRDTWMSLEGRRQLERLAIEMAADAEIFDIPLRWLTQAQVNAVRNGNTRIKGLASHAQIDPAYRTDPGNGFPYGYLLKRIKHHSGNVSHQANAPKELDWLDMVSKNELEDMFRASERRTENYIERRLGDVVNVPSNYGSKESREKNPHWYPHNVDTEVWNNTIESLNLLAALPDAVLDAPVKLEGDFEGTTTLRKKIAWMAHEQHRGTDATLAVSAQVAALAELVSQLVEKMPDTAQVENHFHGEQS